MNFHNLFKNKDMHRMNESFEYALAYRRGETPFEEVPNDLNWNCISKYEGSPNYYSAFEYIFLALA